MEIIGGFSLTTFRNKIYEFIVYEDHIDCVQLKISNIRKILLKPNLEMYADDENFSLNDHLTIEQDYIKKISIRNDLLKYIIDNRLARISTEMAIYYGLDKELGFDIKDKTNTFKWAKKKGLILAKQREGNFN